MLIICCLLGNWLSQAEDGIKSIIEVRRNGLFLTTTLPVGEYCGINSQLCQELNIPTHIHNINDMTSDFNPILFESDNIYNPTSSTTEFTYSLENYHPTECQLNEIIRNHNSGIILSTTYSGPSLNFPQISFSLPNFNNNYQNNTSQILVPEDLPFNNDINQRIFYIEHPDNIDNNTRSEDKLPTYEEATTINNINSGKL
uniref:Astacin domain-containing protein n=1 Tax=Parastrongyloides trichosuri TaxID=131310 RepID=A0A0N4ZVI8_PARTI